MLDDLECFRNDLQEFPCIGYAIVQCNHGHMLHNLGSYIYWDPYTDQVTLDGEFTPKTLLQIAQFINKHINQRSKTDEL